MTVEFQAIENYYERLRSLDAEELASELKTKIIGQDAFLDEFVPFLCLALRGRVELIAGAAEEDVPRLASAFLVGPTASGKTHTLKTICKTVGIDCQFVDCSSLTGTGWKGNSVDSELARLARAQKSAPGVITLLVWDEADKMRNDLTHDRSFNPQHSLLKPLDGGEYRIDRDNGNAEIVLMDYVVNVFAGAFTGIEEIVARRHNARKQTFGFTATAPLASEDDPAALRADIRVDDFVEWGMMSELCGRCGAIFNLPALRTEHLALIVKGTDHSLEKKLARLAPSGCELSLSDEAVRVVVEKAQSTGLGVRALENVLAPLASAVIAEAGKKDATSVVITAHEGELGYRLGCETREKAKPVGTERKYKLPNWSQFDGGDQTRIVEAIAADIDRRCAQFDLDYFVGDERGIKGVSYVFACLMEPDELSLGALYERDRMALLVEFLVYTARYRCEGPCSLGRLYKEAVALTEPNAFIDNLKQRAQEIGAFESALTVWEARKIPRLIPAIGKEFGPGLSAKAWAVSQFIRRLTQGKNFARFKGRVYCMAKSPEPFKVEPIGEDDNRAYAHSLYIPAWT